MYINSAYLHNSTAAFCDTSAPLVVGSCGIYRIYTKSQLKTSRPKGRVDYQLLYIASGQAHFYFDGKKQLVGAGNMILYRPDEPQKYIYYKDDKTEVYWVHFTGYDVENILREYGIDDCQRVIASKTSPYYQMLFEKIIDELQKCRDNYEEMTAMLLREIFILLHRNIVMDNQKIAYLESEMEQAIHYFNKHYNSEICIEEYASSRGMSISWFIRSFRRYTNKTPMQYIISLRIANAKMLLETTDYSIKEIGCIVGYDNPLYFSRLFSKYTGLSPAKYRSN